MSESSYTLAPSTRASASVPKEIRSYLRSLSIAPELRKLQRLSTTRFCSEIAANYLSIAAAISLALLVWGKPWFAIAYPLAILIIAARQHALAILMHEASHYLASPDRRINEWLGSLLCAAPLLVNMQNYRRAHLAHHSHLNTERDPDWQRKTSSEQERKFWDFPTRQTPAALFIALYKRSISHLLVTLKENSTAGTPGSTTSESLGPRPLVRNSIYILVAAALTMTGSWLDYP